MKWGGLFASSLSFVIAFVGFDAHGQDVEPNIATGREIIRENDCNGACHQKVVKGADSLTLYTRTIRKVNSSEELKRQVEMCVSLLNAPIFPEDIAHVVRALDHDAYHLD